MKNKLLILPLLALLTACGSDVDTVKNGVMNFNKTTTLGQALDSWNSCAKSEWKEHETKSGIKVVEFKCSHKIIPFAKKLKSLLPKQDQAEAAHLDIKSNIQSFQFTINKDDTFQINNVQSYMTWTNGKTFQESQKPIQRLKYAYDNVLLFDPSELNKDIAAQLSYPYALMNAQAK